MKNRGVQTLMPACLIAGPFALSLTKPWNMLGSVLLMVGLLWIASMVQNNAARLEKLEEA